MIQKEIIRISSITILFSLSTTTWAGDDIHVGTYTYKDKSVYYGDVRSGRPYGYGECEYSDGSHYEGNFIKGNAKDMGASMEQIKHRILEIGTTIKCKDMECTIIQTTTVMKVL